MFMLTMALWPTSMSVAAAAGPEQDAGLELGIAPFLPPRILAQNYLPMRVFLEQQLGKPVVIVMAPDYKTFYERTQHREYPVVITVANAAYLAYTESGYIPMLRPVIDTRPVLVVPKNSSLTHIQMLRGKTIALPDSLALVAMQALPMLREAGLDPVKDVHLINLTNHSAAVNHVTAGEVAAAIVSDRALLQMPAATQAAVRVIETWDNGAAPGVVYLANPSLSPQRIAQLTQAILKFVRETPEGREFIKKMGYGGLVPATAQDLEPLAPYGAMFKATVAKANEKSE
jgi:ABC-type phosphate/phosphonate transport system substrate-binding protein